jgi:hypothetical protein
MIEEVQSVVIEQQGSKWWSFYKWMKKLRQKDCRLVSSEERANEGTPSVTKYKQKWVK